MKIRIHCWRLSSRDRGTGSGDALFEGRSTADEIDYRVIGDDMQAVVVSLDPEEAVIAEAGAMLYMTEGIEGPFDRNRRFSRWERQHD